MGHDVDPRPWSARHCAALSVVLKRLEELRSHRISWRRTGWQPLARLAGVVELEHDARIDAQAVGVIAPEPEERVLRGSSRRCGRSEVSVPKRDDRAERSAVVEVGAVEEARPCASRGKCDGPSRGSRRCARVERVDQGMKSAGVPVPSRRREVAGANPERRRMLHHGSSSLGSHVAVSGELLGQLRYVSDRPLSSGRGATRREGLVDRDGHVEGVGESARESNRRVPGVSG